MFDKNKIKEMITILFDKTPTSDIESLVNYIDTYKTFGVDSNLRCAHFLAQVREEVGNCFKPLFENLNYSTEALPKLFKALTPELSEKYGRNSKHPADQKMIANIAYANKLGNGDVNSGDGWKYRGTGSLQITGKSNFTEVQKRIDKYAPNSGIDIVNGIGTDTIKGSLLVGLGFWIWKDLYKTADLGSSDEVVDKVTAIINKFTQSYDNRKAHFNKIKHLV
jgi:putative chitinase